jgi:hypothetical protein
MVCSKCQKLTKTTLATPEVKKKSEIYHGSAAAAKGTDKKSATLANAGISKVRPLDLSGPSHLSRTDRLTLGGRALFCRASSCRNLPRTHTRNTRAPAHDVKPRYRRAFRFASRAHTRRIVRSRPPRSFRIRYQKVSKRDENGFANEEPGWNSLRDVRKAEQKIQGRCARHIGPEIHIEINEQRAMGIPPRLHGCALPPTPLSRRGPRSWHCNLELCLQLTSVASVRRLHTLR